MIVRHIKNYFFLFLIALPNFVMAQNPRDNLNQATPQQIKDFGSDPAVVVGKIIQGFLGLAGVITVIFIIYAGYMWATAGGDSAKVQKAKTLIVNSVVGLVLVLAAYTITFTILTAIGVQ